MSSPNRSIRLLIVDDHFIVRMGLTSALNLETDMQVVGEAGNGRAAIEAYRRHQPDVLLMDYQLPELNGAEATQAIRAEFPAARVIILSVYKGEEDVHRAVRAGAMAYLPKSSEPEELLEAIRTVYAGERYFPATIARQIEGRAGREELSGREIEVLRMIVRGHSTKESAALLGISENTVKFHTKRVFDKLGVLDRVQATTAAIERGIVHLEG
ncbi:MAG: response regulator transcription factor [Verrucomicrobiaceae bacterium]|nr:MAG: response regulator transcription factor [Verrucomicrobiaceae bacterium]